MQAQKLLTLHLVLTFALYALSSSVFAQTPTPPASQTCDLCGYCVGNPPPKDYAKCKSCITNADGTPKTGYTYSVIGCVPTTPAGFVQSFLKLVTILTSGVVFLAIIYGSFLVLTSSGDPGKVNVGKSIITSSILGLLLLIFSVFLLRFIGFDILGLPGFGG